MPSNNTPSQIGGQSIGQTISNYIEFLNEVFNFVKREPPLSYQRVTYHVDRQTIQVTSQNQSASLLFNVNSKDNQAKDNQVIVSP